MSSDELDAGTDDAPVPLPPVVSFAALYRREYRSLVALAWGLTGSRETGEDIAQEALLGLHRAWESGRSIDNPAAYVRRACANLAVSWTRRRLSELRLLTRLRQQPEASSSLDETASTFWAEVRRLPRRQAQAVALFYGYGMSVAEVAETLQLSPGTAKTHLHRGRQALAGRLGVEPGTDVEAEEVRR